MAVEAKAGKKTKPAAVGKPVKSLFNEGPKQNDLAQLWQDVQDRPLVYAGIGVFLLACLLAGFLYRANAVSKRAELLTAYSQALDKEGPAEQLAALEPLSQTTAKNNDEVVYVTGETAYRAGAYDKAKVAFERMRGEFAESPFAPEAVEGLGNIAENAKDYENALAFYKEVTEKWDTSFAARRQPMNIAKMEERRGRLSEAVAAYQEQLQVFPGSTLALEAGAALTRLRKSNPDLFPVAEAPAPPVSLAPDAPADATTAPSDPNLQLETPTVLDQPVPSESELELKLDVSGLGAETAPPSGEAPAPGAAPKQ